MRRANDRPTTIYWLVDVRPETQQAVRSIGFPFYCGKTVDAPEFRLKSHRQSARINPHRPVSRWLNACGEHVRVYVVATVPADGDWSAAERRWIEVLRYSFPGGANANAGGQGTPGMVHTAEARAKISAIHKGKIVSTETRAQIAAYHRSRRTPEQQAKFEARRHRKSRPKPKLKRISATEIPDAIERAARRLLEMRKAKRIARKQERTSITC